MDILWILVSTNVATIIMLFGIFIFKRHYKKITIHYFAEVKMRDSFLKKSTIVLIKAQLISDNLPLGSPFLVCENEFEQIQEERINKLLTDVAKPLLEAGISTTTLKFFK